MAPTRPHNKSSRSKAARRARKQQQTARSPRQLLSDATATLEQGDAPGAAAAASQALEIIEGSSDRRQQKQLEATALTLLGEIHLELGDPAQARAFFQRAVKADVEPGEDDAEGLLSSGGFAAGVNKAEKFLWLAQLSEDGGADSVGWYERGAAVLRSQLAWLDGKVDEATSSLSLDTAASPQPPSSSLATPAQRQLVLLEEARRDVSRRLASALCAVAEVYMTDLSWETDAEQRCEALVTEATLLAPDFPDAWQTVASVRISQGRVEDARVALSRSMEPWGALSEDGEGDAPEDTTRAPPPFPTRVSLVRLLMEVEWEDKAVAVAERLAREDDQSVEVLYLGGFGQFMQGEKLRGSEKGTSEEEQQEWRAVWSSARRWLKQCLALFVAQEYEDERLGQHAQELLGALNKELGESPDNDDDDDDDEGGWEDDDDDSDEDGDERMG